MESQPQNPEIRKIIIGFSVQYSSYLKTIDH